MSNLVAGSHAVASNLVGFPSTQLRVRIVEILSDGVHANVVTASLVDAGTPLTLKLANLAPAEGPAAGRVALYTIARSDNGGTVAIPRDGATCLAWSNDDDDAASCIVSDLDLATRLAADLTARSSFVARVGMLGSNGVPPSDRVTAFVRVNETFMRDLLANIAAVAS